MDELEIQRGEPASGPYLGPVDQEWPLHPARNISWAHQETSKNLRNHAALG